MPRLRRILKLYVQADRSWSVSHGEVSEKHSKRGKISHIQRCVVAVAMTERDIQNDIRRLIAKRLNAMHESSNEMYLAHEDGVFRGLLWALTGKDHGHYLTRDTVRILRKAKIYYEIQEDGKVYFDESQKPL